MNGESRESTLQVRLERDRFSLDVRLEWHSDSLVLFGASGSGKTTLMRAALGLEPEADVRFQLRGNWLSNPDRSIRVPTHARRIGWVPQSPTLFPDRSVRANIEFGAQRDDRTQSLAQAVEVLELRDRLEARVSELSGGEKQRVALARALASQPCALFLDEPLAALDLALRSRVLPYLLRIRNEVGIPLLHITHDPDEAILLGEEIAILDAGRVTAQGEPRETLWSRAVLPLATRFGLENVLEVVGTGDSGSSTRVRTPSGLELTTPWPVAAGEPLRLGLRAEDLLIGLDKPGHLSARNVCRGRIERIEEHADHRLLHLDVQGEPLVAKLTEGAVRELALSRGAQVYLIMKSQALRRI